MLLLLLCRKMVMSDMLLTLAVGMGRMERMERMVRMVLWLCKRAVLCEINDASIDIKVGG